MLKSPLRTPLKRLSKLLEGDSKTQCHRILPELCRDPHSWGMKTQRALALLEHIRSDMAGYCHSHDLGMDFAHLCLAVPCPWHHHGVAHRPRATSEQVRGPLRPDMHTVVRRYVAPWTKPLGVGYSSAVLADSAARTIQNERTLRSLCSCQVFISHCWNEPFVDFCSTLRARLDSDTVIWVCSLAINQNASIGAEIGGGLHEVPFALALKSADRVLVVMDTQAEPLTRAWCVLEAHFAFTWRKAYDIALPSAQNAIDDVGWQVVDERMRQLDICECVASYQEDLVRILDFVDRDGGVDALNRSIRETGAHAASRAAALAAAAAGRVDALRSLSKEALSVKDDRGRTLLHYAAAQNHPEVVALLAGNGGEVDCVDVDGRTALSVAVEHGAEPCCRRLLGCGASVDLGDDLLPLHYAAVCGSTAVAECLLQAAADVNAKTRAARTPLYYASMVYDVPMMELMLQRCAATDQKSKAGFLPLHIASQSFRTENVPGTVNSTPRGSAADAVRLLCSHGVSPDVKTSDGRTALHLAADAGKTSTLQALLESRADPAVSNQKRTSPLHAAAKLGHCKCVRILVDARSDINQLTTMGSSPLKSAVSEGRIAASRLLLELLADPNAGAESLLPLHCAAKDGRVEILRALLACRAHPAARAGKSGLPALALAAKAGEADVVEELLFREPLLASLHPARSCRCARALAPGLAAVAQGLLSAEGQADGSLPARVNNLLDGIVLGTWQAGTDAARAAAPVATLGTFALDVGMDRAEARAWDSVMALVEGCLQAYGAGATRAGLLAAATGVACCEGPSVS